MRFNLSDLNPATRFYFDDGNKKNGWVEMRIMDGDTSDKINKKYTKIKVEYRRGQRYEYISVNDKKSNEETWDYCIFDWLCFDDKGGKMSCTLENKMKLMSGSPTFMNFVLKCLELLNKEADVGPDLEKNL